MTSFPGWSQENTLVLPLDEAPPTVAVEVDGRRLEPKGELHITLVGTTLGNELRRVLGDRLEAGTRPAFEALDWSWSRTGHGALVAKRTRLDDGQRGEAASVIEFVELPAMAHFHRWLGQLLGRQLPAPPPHVTLYTQGKARGLGIASERALRGMLRGEFALDALRPA